MQQEALYSLLFKRNSYDPGAKDLLEQLAKDHPSFSVAQYFLLKQTPKGSDTYDDLAARTLLFFDNPYWLNFQLTRTEGNVMETHLAPTELPETIQVAENSHMHDFVAVIENDITALPAVSNNTNENSSKKVDQFSFEPMHLVDYFASQGIKLNTEVIATDKLGKQLKSFTEWLKTMKRLHVSGETGNLPASVSGSFKDPAVTVVDTNIQTLAEKSNTAGEILTESMAEVLAKQGKTGRALELYQKLSLLDPSKSAYFAAKIEHLKEM